MSDRTIIRTMATLAIVALSLAPDCKAEPSETQICNESGFCNPVIWADVPDPDVIRVGDDFYMVSTTMHLMPGCPVMHSRDLVNWETIGYVFDKLEDTSRYNMEGGTVYGRGQWATSIRYRDGRFYVLFSPNDEPYKAYIYTTENPAGEWKLLCRTNHFHDSSLLLDDDGRAYVFSGSGNIRLTELKPDLSGILEGGINKNVIFPDDTETGLHEGSRVIKHNGKYYAFVISWPKGKPRRQLCYRADNIEGPYEKCVVLESQFGGFPYVGQGCLVDDADGNWWGMIFQDRGGVGRVLTLNPCTWKNGWPMLGDSEGKVPLHVNKKIVPCSGDGVLASDEFSDGKKSILWQWNHNPDNASWSLTERPGYLRLSTSKVVKDIFHAPNTISQRMVGPKSEAAIRMDVSKMKQGDVAGLSAFNGDSGLLSVVADKDGKWIVASTSSVAFESKNKEIKEVVNREVARVPLKGNVVHFKVATDFNPGEDMADFYYSLDGKNWKPIGERFKMKFDFTKFFMGTRFAIYNYATESTGGMVDIDWFRTSVAD